MEYISPEENALFVKVLQWLAIRTAERDGKEIVGLNINRVSPEEPGPITAA